jgi:hypothetical protein
MGGMIKPKWLWIALILLVIMIAKNGEAVGHAIYQFTQGLSNMSNGMNGG